MGLVRRFWKSTGSERAIKSAVAELRESVVAIMRIRKTGAISA